MNLRVPASIGALSAATLLVTFGLHSYILVALGPGATTDAFFAGSTLSQFVLVVFSGSISNVLTPLLVDEARFEREAWGLFLLAAAGYAALTVVLQLLAPLWIPLLFPGFNQQARALTLSLTRIHLVGMFFSGIFGVLSAISHSRSKFLMPEVASLISIVIASVLLPRSLGIFGITGAATIFTFRSAFQSIWLIRVLGRPRNLRPNWATVREVLNRLRPLVFGASYYKTGVLVDRFLASLAPAGSLSLLNFGQQGYTAASQVLANALVVPVFPMLVGRANDNDWFTFRRLYIRRLMVIVILTVIAVFGVLVLGPGIVRLVVGPSRFASEDIDVLFVILLALSGVLIGGSASALLSRTFYAQGNTSIPVRVGALAFTFGAISKFIGFWTFGVMGIAIGASLHLSSNSLGLFTILERQMRSRLRQ